MRGEGTMLMIRSTYICALDVRAFAAALPLALVASLAVSSAAFAQTPPPPAPAKPAAAAPKPAPAAPKPAPAAPSPTTTATAPAGEAQPTLLGQYGDWGAYS